MGAAGINIKLINQSINQSINQPIRESVNKLMNLFFIYLENQYMQSQTITIQYY